MGLGLDGFDGLVLQMLFENALKAALAGVQRLGWRFELKVQSSQLSHFQNLESSWFVFGATWISNFHSISFGFTGQNPKIELTAGFNQIRFVTADVVVQKLLFQLCCARGFTE